MLTNKDRIQSEVTPYAFPIAYAMKGPSMSNEDLRHMVCIVCQELKKWSIPVLCEVYNGQWHNYITTDTEGKNLMKLGWRHKWQEIIGYSKNKCIEYMVAGCRIKPGDMELLNISTSLKDKEEVCCGNIEVKCSIVNLDKDKKKKISACDKSGRYWVQSSSVKAISNCLQALLARLI